MSGPAKNERQAIIPIAVGALFIVLLDYATFYKILPINLHDKLGILDRFVLIFHKWGEIIRAIYILTFSLLCYLAYTNRLIDKNLLSEKISRSLLIILTTISCIIFIECFRLPMFLIKIIYPVSLISSTFLIMILMASLAEVILPQDSGTQLSLEQTKTEAPFGVTLDAQGGYMNVSNPFRSISVIGGAGAGKSASVIEPILFEFIRKGFTGCIYDFKFPTLGNFAYSAFLYNKSVTQNLDYEVKFYSVNFTELDKSNRFNPLDAALLTSSTYAQEFCHALYCNLDKEAKKGGFFPDSASGLLMAVMWFMKKNHVEYCTLPHVINIILNAKIETLVNMVISDDETKGMMKSVKEAAEKKAYDQLAGVVGSLTMQLAKINTPEIVWVTSGNDFTLDLNNPYDPKFIILGSRPDLKAALNPVLAFILTIITNTVNNQGKLPCVVAIDELPTLYVPGLDGFAATARSNKCVSFFSAQDKSQLIAQYNKENTTALFSNHNYQFTGNNSDPETAETISKMVGEEYRMITSFNKGGNSSESGDSNSRGVSYSEQKRKIIELQEFNELKPGEFVSKVVESPENKTWLRGRLKMVTNAYPDFKVQKIPSFVTNFILDDEDLENINKTINNYLEDVEYYRKNNRDFNNLIISFKGDTNNPKFNEELYRIISTKFSLDKKNKIISDNFRKIQQECDEILMLYTDTSDVDSLIQK